MAYPMEISRTWKFPWVKPAATHGNFQGLEISMTWKIPGPDTHLPLQNFLMENILQWTYFCSAICCCLFEIFMGKKPRGGLVKDQTLFNIFFGNLPVYILIFCFNYFHFGSEYNGESMPDKWRNSGMSSEILNQIWKQPGHFFVL